MSKHPEKNSDLRQQAETGLQIIAAPDGTIEHVSAGWERELGYTLRELEGRNIEELVHPDDLVTIRSALKQQAPKQIFSEFQIRFQHKDGSWHTMNWWSAVPSEGGKVHAIAHDLTNASETRERLTMALKGADLGTWDWHIPSGHVVFNERWAEMLGYQLDEIEPNVSTWEHLVHPDDSPDVQTKLQAHLDGETDRYETEHRVRHKDGQWIWILDKGRVIERDEKGAPVRASGTHLDITTAKNVQLELAEAHQRLEYINLTLNILRDVNQLASRAKDSQTYLQDACDSIVSRQAITSAWIVQLDPESGVVIDSFFAGLDGEFDPRHESLQTDDLPASIRRAVKQKTPVIIHDVSAESPDCPLRDHYAARTGLVQRMEYEGRIYGILSISSSSPFAEDEEEFFLIRELADALAGTLAQAETEITLSLTQSALENSSDSAFWAGKDGRFIYVNQAACRQLGYSKEELLSMSVGDIDADYPAEEWPEVWDLMKSTRSMRFDSHHKTKEGRIIPVDIFGSFVEHHGREYIFSFVRDITHRIEQQQELEDSNSRLVEANRDLQSARQAALNMMKDALLTKERAQESEVRLQRAQKVALVGDWEFNIKTGEFSSSQFAKAIYGLTDSEATYEKIQEIPLPEYRPMLNAALNELIQHNAPYDVEFTIRRPSDQALIDIHSLAEYDPEAETVFGIIQDTTERKKVEKELRQSTQLLSKTQELARVGSWSLNLKSNDLKWSDENYQIFGISKGTPLTYEIFLDTVHPEDRAYVDEQWRTHFLSNDYDIEHRVLIDGEVKWVRQLAEIVFAKDGTPVSAIGFTQEITKQKQAQEELTKSRDLLRDAQAAAHIGSWEYDIAEDKHLWSDEMFRIFGLEVGAPLPGWEALRDHFPEDWDRLDAAVKGAMQGTAYDEEFHIIWPDGTTHWGRTQGSPAKDENGKIIRLVGTVQDITEKKEAELELKESKEYLEAMWKAMDVGIALIDAKTREILRVNPALAQMSGYSEDELMGRVCHGVMCPACEDACPVADLGNEIDQSERVLLHKAGHEVPIDKTVTPIILQGREVFVETLVDITDRKQAEVDLRESRSLLQTVINTLPERVWWKDLDSRFLGCNIHVARDAGFKSPDLLVGKTDYDMVWSGQAEQFIACDRELIESGQPKLNQEEAQPQPDGSTRWIEVNQIPLRDSDGEIIGTLGSYSDITDRKQAESRLQHQAALLEGISQASNILLSDPKIDRAIPKVLSIIGRASGQDRGYVFQEHNDPATGNPLMTQQYEWVREGISSQMGAPETTDIPFERIFPEWNQKLAAGEHLQYLVKNLPQTGQNLLAPQKIQALILVPILIKKRLRGFIGFDNCRREYVWSNDEIGILKSFAADVSSALIRHEWTLRLQRLSTAIEQSPESVIITDTDGTIVYANPTFEKVSGYTHEDALGKNPTILKSDQHDEAFYSEMWQTLKAGKVWEGRIINKRKDGTHYTEQAIISPVKDENGMIVNYVAVKRDITKELAHEEQLRQAQKMEAVGHLAGGIAHDFNNILQGVIGFSELLKMSLDANSLPYQNADEIHKAAKRAADLTRQLLAFSHKQPAQRADVDLNQVIHDAEGLLHVLLGERIKLHLNLASDIDPVVADEGQVSQVVMNLAVNARDAMPDGGHLTIATERVTLSARDVEQLNYGTPGPYVCLAVSDTGHGMTEEVKDHLFDPFFTTKSVGKGTGLGMAVVYGIMQQFDGWISVYTEKGMGSCFRLYFPAARRAVPLEPEMEENISQQPLRLLFVEDDPDNERMMIESLKDTCFTVIAAQNAEEALQRFEHAEEPFDALIADMMLPGLRGDELADRLRERQPALPVLLLSGYCDHEVRWKHLKDRDYRFLNKPFTFHEVVHALNCIIDDKDHT